MYKIFDIDGTLTTTGDEPRQDVIDALKTDVQDFATSVLIVSGRPISRLDDTKAWLEENGVPFTEIYLQDFAEQSTPNVVEAFKAFKYSKLLEQYGEEIACVVDNDADAREAAAGMGIKALTPDEYVAQAYDSEDEDEDEAEDRATYEVPEYIRAAAKQGLEWVEEGLGGDGLQPETIAEAKDLAAGRVVSEKLVRMAAWIRRHRQDWEGVPQNSDAQNPDYPGPGAVAGFLWGVNTTADGGADRVLAWADPIIAAENAERHTGKEKEVRTAPLGAFEVRATEDGQRVVSGYAALFNTPSEGLPFTEVIAPGAFKRTLSRAKRGEAVVKFLHGHDENRMLATTASGRLTLQEDAQGLRVEARLDPSNPEAAAVISNLTHEAKAMGWSFGFTIPNGSGDKWNGNERTLKEIRLHEVSILSGSTPAYPATIGMAAVRKIAAPRLGVEAEALVDTLEAVRAGKDLTAEQTEMVDTIKSKLGAKPTAIHNSIADAQLRLARMMAEDI